MTEFKKDIADSLTVYGHAIIEIKKLKDSIIEKICY